MKDWGDRGRWGTEETEEDEGLRKTLYSMCVSEREREREREREIRSEERRVGKECLE